MDRGSGKALLAVEGLGIELERRALPPVAIARDVSLRVEEGEIVGLIGESGSGKTMTAKSLIGLLPERIHVVAGRAMFRARDLFALTPPQMRAVRGAEIALIPQDALHALNPVQVIGRQVGEPVEVHTASPDRPTYGTSWYACWNGCAFRMPSARTSDYPAPVLGRECSSGR